METRIEMLQNDQALASIERESRTQHEPADWVESYRRWYLRLHPEAVAFEQGATWAHGWHGGEVSGE